MSRYFRKSSTDSQSIEQDRQTLLRLLLKTPIFAVLLPMKVLILVAKLLGKSVSPIRRLLRKVSDSYIGQTIFASTLALVLGVCDVFTAIVAWKVDVWINGWGYQLLVVAGCGLVGFILTMLAAFAMMGLTMMAHDPITRTISSTIAEVALIVTMLAVYGSVIIGVAATLVVLFGVSKWFALGIPAILLIGMMCGGLFEKMFKR